MNWVWWRIGQPQCLGFMESKEGGKLLHHVGATRKQHSSPMSVLWISCEDSNCNNVCENSDLSDRQICQTSVFYSHRKFTFHKLWDANMENLSNLATRIEREYNSWNVKHNLIMLGESSCFEIMCFFFIRLTLFVRNDVFLIHYL